MDDESKQLLRDIRDIALRGEQRYSREVRFRFVAMAIAVIAYVTIIVLLFSWSTQPVSGPAENQVSTADSF